MISLPRCIVITSLLSVIVSRWVLNMVESV